ncbi:hyaluronidase-5-like [Megalops cyprinoides]|uniref:hyaluronidase-5-like n=1 Tax=Megalops cyprinoides TaxID=118141 RepID=UPI001863AD80|nr:hyaluronidase-5-like [Megalops cyprinoides]
MEQLIQMRKGCPQLLPLLTLSILATLSSALPLPPTAIPLSDGQPFVVVWNMPTPTCRRYDIPLDTSPFLAVTTPAKVPGQFLELFYSDRLGLYPYVNPTTKQQFYGGIPQRGNLSASLAKAQTDIAYYIPSESTPGLAVIDWEDWRPLWDRNWGSKRIYCSLSVAYARQCFPLLPTAQIIAKAKMQFQAAARDYMVETLDLGVSQRPQYLWGIYLFPNCYNYGWADPGYTGKCPEEVKSQNDELLWLWEASTALYPSVYLPSSLGGSHNAALFVRNRVQEAMRVAALPKRPFTVPIYVYTRPVFTDQNRRFLSEGDLVSTIGESAAVGASGSVLWGASADFDDKASCEALSGYLTSTLNPYIANVTAAAKLCSDTLCQGNGRCVRQDYNTDAYLHLNPSSFKIQSSDGRYVAVGRPTLADLRVFAEKFTCQCFAGLDCSPKLTPQLRRTLMVIRV